ncbi:MAG: transglycosylase SLT domain-containing protein [Fibrobacterota bacterium]
MLVILLTLVSCRENTGNPSLSDPDSLKNILYGKKAYASGDEYLPMDIIKRKEISKYDHLIKKYSRRYGFDWRLIAAQVFAESNFDPSAVSHCGALGLMQIMPATARYLGKDEKVVLRPRDNIALGCFYDRKLYNQWYDVKEDHRIYFTFAAYNAGRGNVLKAVRKSGNKKAWECIKPHLPGETRHYVPKIMKQYELYRTMHPM